MISSVLYLIGGRIYGCSYEGFKARHCIFRKVRVCSRRSCGASTSTNNNDGAMRNVAGKGKWSSTVLTPRTTLETVRGENRLRREAIVAQESDFDGLYEWQMRQPHSVRPEMFVLHDGPPYANGKPHFGHALNKILKDIALRYQLLRGRRVHYVPGWDCHGLPIELGAIAESLSGGKRGGTSDIEDTRLLLRARARKFAAQWVTTQRSAFKSWGLLGDWSRPYLTCDPEFIASELDLFTSLYEKGLIFRERKPVHWSYAAKTALAEAELVYNDKHTSPSVYVKFWLKRFKKMTSECCDLAGGKGEVAAVIWTTNPWTIPANRAICYAPDKTYCLVRDSRGKENDGGLLLIAAESKDHLEQTLSTKFRVISEFKGDALEGCSYVHPMYDEERPLLPSLHVVTMAKGTGLVHVAPAHGPDDFLVAIENGLPVDECVVDEDLRFVAEVGPSLAGLFALNEGNQAVLTLLGDRHVMHASTIQHSYPYDWRTNTPVVFRASLQWFIDTGNIKTSALKYLEDVTIYPAKAKVALMDSLRRRPYWCLSRQRIWGVPMPVFYETLSKKPIFNRVILNHLLDLLSEHGSDFWWSLPIETLLPQSVRKQCGLNEESDFYERGNDILDIWFDSGSSWHHVLKNVESGVSDLCLEGVDQIGGWFQASLMTSCALRDRAPYRTLYLHGFTLDENGRKMSKSLGNVIDPVAVVNGDASTKQQPIGIDVLRWWIAAHGTGHDNVPVARSTLDVSSENYNKIRNTFKFLLGLLDGFDFEGGSVAFEDMLPLDRYMLHRLHQFKAQVTQSYESYSYGAVVAAYIGFVVNDVSRIYCHLVKDRMYCDSRQSKTRRSCQTAVGHMVTILAETLAPVMPFLCEDIYLNHPLYSRTNTRLFRTKWSSMEDSWHDEPLATTISRILEVCDAVNQVVTTERLKLRDFNAVIFADKKGRLREELELLLKVENECWDSPLREILQTASVSLVNEASALPHCDRPPIKGTFNQGDSDCYALALVSSDGSMCDRCRRRSTLSPRKDHAICIRCSKVLRSSGNISSL